jgi:hypothetical protein
VRGPPFARSRRCLLTGAATKQRGAGLRFRERLTPDVHALGRSERHKRRGLRVFIGGVQSAMSDQPPEDLGAHAVLLTIAAVLIVFAIGIVVLLYGARS